MEPLFGALVRKEAYERLQNYDNVLREQMLEKQEKAVEREDRLTLYTG